MNSLRNEIRQIVDGFVSSVLDTMRTASLSDLSGQAGSLEAGVVRRGPSGPRKVVAPGRVPTLVQRVRRKRATPEEVQRQKDVAFAAARELKGGFSKGDVMRGTGSKVNLGRALTLLVRERKLKKVGDRRLARYWVR